MGPMTTPMCRRWLPGLWRQSSLHWPGPRLTSLERRSQRSSPTNRSCRRCRTLPRRKQDRPRPSPGAGFSSSVVSLVPLLCCWLGNFDLGVRLDVRSVELVGNERRGREVLRRGQARYHDDELGPYLAEAVDDAAWHEED